jgi:hypothetical protein
MSKERHDKIVSYVAGKMQRLGFRIKYLEGDHTSVTMERPELPYAVSTHRPDVYGVKPNGLCIGEAKTPRDFSTKRTRTQLIDFIKEIRKHPNNLLIIGIPYGTRTEFLQIINSIGITMDYQIDIIEIPDQFLS